MSAERILKDAGINVVYADAGDCIKSGEFSVKCMHPCEGYDYESANTILLYILWNMECICL
ncbi:MAG: hypothetical protein ACLS9K_07835 [Lachnospira eligens]